MIQLFYWGCEIVYLDVEFYIIYCWGVSVPHAEVITAMCLMKFQNGSWNSNVDSFWNKWNSEKKIVEIVVELLLSISKDFKISTESWIFEIKLVPKKLVVHAKLAVLV